MESKALVKIDALENKALVEIEKVDTLTINNKQDMQEASDLLTSIKSRYKEVDATRVFIVKPFNEQINRINNEFKPLLDKMKVASSTISQLMTDWTISEKKRIAQEKARLEAIATEQREALEAKAIEAVKEGNRAEAEALLNAKNAVVVAKNYDTAKVEGFHTRKSWKARIVDKNAVPEHFKLVDMVALNKLATASKGLIPVAGVEFYEEVLGVSK
jgi:hypothetical protein